MRHSIHSENTDPNQDAASTSKKGLDHSSSFHPLPCKLMIPTITLSASSQLGDTQSIALTMLNPALQQLNLPINQQDISMSSHPTKLKMHPLPQLRTRTDYQHQPSPKKNSWHQHANPSVRNSYPQFMTAPNQFSKYHPVTLQLPQSDAQPLTH